MDINNMIFRRLHCRRMWECSSPSGFHWFLVLFGCKTGGLFDNSMYKLKEY